MSGVHSFVLQSRLDLSARIACPRASSALYSSLLPTRYHALDIPHSTPLLAHLSELKRRAVPRGLFTIIKQRARTLARSGARPQRSPAPVRVHTPCAHFCYTASGSTAPQPPPLALHQSLVPPMNPFSNMELLERHRSSRPGRRANFVDQPVPSFAPSVLKSAPLAGGAAAGPGLVDIPESVGDFRLLTTFTLPHAPSIQVAKYMSMRTGLKVVWASTPGQSESEPLSAWLSAPRIASPLADTAFRSRRSHRPRVLHGADRVLLQQWLPAHARAPQLLRLVELPVQRDDGPDLKPALRVDERLD